jgi:sulfatase modifying factor 1
MTGSKITGLLICLLISVLVVPPVQGSATFTDDFANGVNGFYWSYASNQALYQVDASQGAVRFHKTQGGGGGLEYATLRFNHRITGNFDIRVRYSDASIGLVSGSPGNQVQLQTFFGNQFVAVVRSDEAGQGNNSHLWRDPPGQWDGKRTSWNTSGTLRITRVGTTVSAYATVTEQGAEVEVLLYQFETNADPVTALSFSLQNNGTTDAISVTFDDFAIAADSIAYQPPQTLQLWAGWNFLTLPAQPTDNSASVILGGLQGLRIAWSFDNATKQWLRWSPSGGNNTLVTMDPLSGYWFYMDGPEGIDISGWGVITSTTTHLYEGWNLVGFQGVNGTDVADNLAGITDRWSAVWGWSNSEWSANIPSPVLVPPGIGSLTAFNKDRAYWIRIAKGMEADWLQGGMVMVPAGSFRMGLDGGICNPDFYHYDDEQNPCHSMPAHTVYLDTFFIDRFETVYDLWKPVYDWAIANGYQFDLPGTNGSQAGGPDMPVTNLYWFDIVKWLNARSEKQGRVPCYYTDTSKTTVYRTGVFTPTSEMVNWEANGFRLPTEAEWEKASRGGVAGTTYPWGDTLTSADANSQISDPYIGQTVPVGSYRPNGYGLYDMAGNVWEWTWDWYYENPVTKLGYDWAYDGIANPRGYHTGTTKARRGSAYCYPVRYLRNFDRVGRGLTYNRLYFGFRSVSNQR